MIEFQNVTKSYRDKVTKKRHYVFRELTFAVPPGRNIGMIGRNGAGKSTLMRLIAGSDVPDSGKIIAHQSISWPVGLSGGFQSSLSARENVRFVARVQGVKGPDLQNIVRKVEEFAEIGPHFDRPVRTYSSGMRSRVGFGMSLAFDFDYYLVDEAMSVGDAHFREKAARAFKEKVGKANIILVSHSMSQIRKMCDCVLLIRNGQVELFDDIEAGIAEYELGAK